MSLLIRHDPDRNPRTIYINRADGSLSFDVVDAGDGGPGAPRDGDGRDLRFLFEHARHFDARIDAGGPTIVFQACDGTTNTPSVGFEAQRGWHGVALVPDLYYHAAAGFETFAVEVPPWEARISRILWRGASTGFAGLDVDNIHHLPRYRLCSAARALGSAGDLGFTSVVQTRDAEQTSLLEDQLARESLMRPYMPADEMSQYKFLVDIDGNSNSWNIIQRLRLGACLIKVSSAWKQWCYSSLVPWEHYVPVAADLSDLALRSRWCLEHEEEAAAIGRRGRELALLMTYEDEMLKAARTVFL